MSVIAVSLLVSAIFAVGLLVGQEYNRRSLNDGRRRLVVVQRERDELARQLAKRNRASE